MEAWQQSPRADLMVARRSPEALQGHPAKVAPAPANSEMESELRSELRNAQRRLSLTGVPAAREVACQKLQYVGRRLWSLIAEKTLVYPMICILGVGASIRQCTEYVRQRDTCCTLAACELLFVWKVASSGNRCADSAGQTASDVFLSRPQDFVVHASQGTNT